MIIALVALICITIAFKFGRTPSALVGDISDFGAPFKPGLSQMIARELFEDAQETRRLPARFAH